MHCNLIIVIAIVYNDHWCKSLGAMRRDVWAAMPGAE